MRSALNSRILVTGANGQLGSELVLALRDVGQVVPVIRPPRSVLAIEGTQYVVDLRESDQIRELVRRVRPTIILNAAAYTAVDRAESEPEVAMDINGKAPGILAEEADRIGATLIHFSTDYVFNGHGKQPWKENDIPDPLNVYGRTKLAGEQAVRNLCDRYLIIRTSWVYGSYGTNFVKTMLRVARDRSEIKVVDDQIGAPTSARFLAEATCTIIQQAMLACTSGNRLNQVLHVACAGKTSWYEYAREIFRQAAKIELPISSPRILPVKSRSLSAAALRPHNSVFDLTLFRSGYRKDIPTWRSELRNNLPTVYAATQSASS